VSHRLERAGVLVVFAKQPVPGLVKTRLSPPLSPEAAAALYAEMLADVLEASARFAAELDLDPVLAVHPPAACAELARDCPAGFRAVPQRGADLAERMTRAVAEAAAAGARRILLRGSDSPMLERRTLEQALAALDTHELVLCPDRDGGYGLVGLTHPHPGLFDHPMSTASVLEQTLARAVDRGLRTRTLEPSFDLDTLDDLQRLAALRGSPAAALCPRTMSWLEEHGMAASPAASSH
jgi:rSAM/selenodomain-associated transferase 1